MAYSKFLASYRDRPPNNYISYVTLSKREIYNWNGQLICSICNKKVNESDVNHDCRDLTTVDGDGSMMGQVIGIVPPESVEDFIEREVPVDFRSCLQTFKDCPKYNVSKITLAKRGFYFDSQRKVVCCKNCESLFARPFNHRCTSPGGSTDGYDGDHSSSGSNSD